MSLNDRQIEVLVAKNIKRLRKLAGLSQCELAKKIEVTPQYLSCIETNRRPPTLRVISRIATVLNFHIVLFFLNSNE